MTITEMIEFFDQLSAQEQDNLLEILSQRRSQLTEGEILPNENVIKNIKDFADFQGLEIDNWFEV